MKQSKKKSKNERGEVTTDTSEIQKIVREYYEKLYANHFDKSARNG